MGLTTEPIAFVGLGAMGFGMATNLIQNGYSVTGFDVYGPTLDRFRQVGGQTASTAYEAISGKNTCVCMVATAQQVQSLLMEGDKPAIDAMPKGAALLLCSTVPCGYVQGLEKALADKGRGDIALLDCPVSGGAGRAAAGTLSIVVGGSESALQKGRHVLQTMSDSNKLYIVKGGVGAGSNMKMCHQVLAAIQILSTSEAMGFANHLGLDLAETGAAVVASLGWSWMFANRLPRLLDPSLPLASAVTIILKDTSIITAEARRAKFPTALTSTAEQVYFAALCKGQGSEDDSRLIRQYERTCDVGPLMASVIRKEEKTALVVNMLKGIHLCAAAEALTLAHHVGLDLDQVLNLCVDAAGGSRMLAAAGEAMIRVLREGDLAVATKQGVEELHVIEQGLQHAVDEAQRMKIPVFLGSQALNLIRLAGRFGVEAATSIVKLWRV
ncbi:oxidoreductase [Xylariaceae sp. FL0662B]|nr:oxidoreductase [Xylariaceae sp. FL0662B]